MATSLMMQAPGPSSTPSSTAKSTSSPPLLNPTPDPNAPALLDPAPLTPGHLCADMASRAEHADASLLSKNRGAIKGRQNEFLATKAEAAQLMRDAQAKIGKIDPALPGSFKNLYESFFGQWNKTNFENLRAGVRTTTSAINQLGKAAYPVQYRPESSACAGAVAAVDFSRRDYDVERFERENAQPLTQERGGQAPPPPSQNSTANLSGCEARSQNPAVNLCSSFFGFRSAKQTALDLIHETTHITMRGFQQRAPTVQQFVADQRQGRTPQFDSVDFKPGSGHESYESRDSLDLAREAYPNEAIGNSSLIPGFLAALVGFDNITSYQDYIGDRKQVRMQGFSTDDELKLRVALASDFRFAISEVNALSQNIVSDAQNMRRAIRKYEQSSLAERQANPMHQIFRIAGFGPKQIALLEHIKANLANEPYKSFNYNRIDVNQRPATNRINKITDTMTAFPGTSEQKISEFMRALITDLKIYRLSDIGALTKVIGTSSQLEFVLGAATQQAPVIVKSSGANGTSLALSPTFMASLPTPGSGAQLIASASGHGRKLFEAILPALGFNNVQYWIDMMAIID